MVAEAASLSFGQLAGLIGLSAAGSAGTGVMNSLITGHHMYRQYKYQKKLQAHAAKLNYDYGMKQLLNQPSQARAGLEAAGYNPLLALDSSMNGGFTSAGTAAMGNSTFEDPTNNAVSAYRAFQLERKQTDANVRNLDSQTVLASQQAETEAKKRDWYQSQVDLNTIDKALREKELSWYDKRQLMEIRTGYINAAANRLGSDALMSQASTAQKVYALNKELRPYEARTSRLSELNEALKRLDDRTNGWSKGAGNSLRDIINSRDDSYRYLNTHQYLRSYYDDYPGKQYK